MIRHVRNGNRVRRYHTVDLLVPETVGHHSANVAMLCATISEKPSATLLLAALTHDLGEQFTGDVPATAKWRYPALKAMLDGIEQGMDMYALELTEDEQSVLKQADMLDLCYKCLEEVQMGNAAVKPILTRGLDWLRSHPVHVKTAIMMEEIVDELSK